MITGIVLAGGLSLRTQTNKLMLTVKGKALISHTCESIRPYVDKLVVVTGRYDKEIRTILKDVEIIYNKDYELGMFTSVKTGVSKADGDFFVIPGDCPFVGKEVFERLISSDTFLIRVPTYKGKHGHPIFFNGSLKQKILDEPDESNLKVFRNKIGYEEIEVSDPNILNDVDTIEEYQNIKTKMERK